MTSAQTLDRIGFLLSERNRLILALQRTEQAFTALGLHLYSQQRKVNSALLKLQQECINWESSQCNQRRYKAYKK